MIREKHQHYATGHDSKNRGKLYPCPSRNCCLWPAWNMNGERLKNF
nr:hypothetical protein [uncultured Nitrososphaera sp.]